MFNISPDREATPVTPAQSAYLSKLIDRHGKPAYLAAKERAGIPADVTLLRLTKSQASRLIAEMITGGRR